MIQSYENLYDNPYNPHLEIVHFEYPVLNIKNEIQTEFAENSQTNEQKEIKTPEQSEIPDKEEIQSVSLTPVYTVKDITPKKSLFRRK